MHILISNSNKYQYISEHNNPLRRHYNIIFKLFCQIHFLNIHAKDIEIASSKLECSDISINATNLEIYKSTINSDNGTLDIKTIQTFMNDSSIICPNIAITSENLDTSKTFILAREGFIIENKNNNKLENVISPEMIYNGVLNFNENNNSILSSARISLLHTLRNIKSICDNINLNKFKQIKQNLGNQPVDKVFKLK